MIFNSPSKIFLIPFYVFFETISFSSKIYAQTNPEIVVNNKVLAAKKTELKITIDGKLTEQDWQTAVIATSFIQIEPMPGEPSQFSTIVSVLYDSKNLYIGAICKDPEGKKNIRVTDLKRDFDGDGSDVFSFVIDGFNDKRNAIFFGTNPYGAQVDFLSFDALLRDMDWSGLWNVRTSITDSGWAAEFQIPWKTIRYKLSKDSLQQIGINFTRVSRKTNERSVWSPYPRNLSSTRMDFAGKLTNLSLPKPATNIQVNPYFATVFTNAKDSAAKIIQSTKPKAGLDVKWAINPNTVADLTINTDFAQADADVQVNNTSRFSVFFPEKRQFFLENASLFGVGLQNENQYAGDIELVPFFSRTIGLDVNGYPIPIEIGTRLVHRSIKRSIGFMGIRQKEYNDNPATNFFVGRYVQNVGRQSRIGGIVSAKQVSNTNYKDAYFNGVAAVEGFFRMGSYHTLNTMLIGSTNSVAQSQKGYAGYVQYAYNSPVLAAWITEAVISDKYSAESGFVSRDNVIATTPGFQFNLRGKWLPSKKYILSYEPAVFSAWYNRFTDKILLERQLTIYPVYYTLVSGGYFGFSIRPNYERLLEPFSPLGIEIKEGEYSYTSYRFNAGSDPSNEISYNFKYDFGEYYNGRLSTINASLQFVPIPNIALKAGAIRNKFHQVGVNKTNAIVSLFTLQTNLAVNPRLQLSSLYQRNTQQKQDALNMRFSWEYKPLSFVYLVWNSRAFSGTDINNQKNDINNEQEGVFKINFVKQF